jgi:hypothetical protein
MQMHVRGIFDLDYITLSIEGQGECAVVARMRRDTSREQKKEA